MVTCETTADYQSLLIRRDGQPIGRAMWHKEPLIQLDKGGWPHGQLTVSEIETVLKEMERVRKSREPVSTNQVEAVVVSHDHLIANGWVYVGCGYWRDTNTGNKVLAEVAIRMQGQRDMTLAKK